MKSTSNNRFTLPFVHFGSSEITQLIVSGMMLGFMISKSLEFIDLSVRKGLIWLRGLRKTIDGVPTAIGRSPTTTQVRGTQKSLNGEQVVCG